VLKIKRGHKTDRSNWFTSDAPYYLSTKPVTTLLAYGYYLFSIIMLLGGVDVSSENEAYKKALLDILKP